MSENTTISEFTINTFHIVWEILFYLLQYFYNYFIDFIYLNCSTMDVIHVLICAKKDKFNNQNLKILCASHLIQLVLYNLYTCTTN